ncbi:MAG: hypothetical protein RSF94_04675, partial [Rikenellaceae bacterium]
YKEDRFKNSDRRAALFATLIYVAALVALFFLVKVSRENTLIHNPPLVNSIIMDFGDANIAAPNIAANEQQEAQDEEVEDVNDPQRVNNTTIDKGVVKSKKRIDSVATRPQQKINTLALYSKKNSVSKANSNNGVVSNSPEGGSPNGIKNSTGNSQSGSFSLEGRSIAGKLISPSYTKNSEGKIVINIKVNRDGVVTDASFNPQHSTISDANMIEAACKAALGTRFSRKSNALFVQTGTITYNFKLR